MCFIKTVFKTFENRTALFPSLLKQEINYSIQSQDETLQCQKIKQQNQINKKALQNSYETLLLKLMSNNLTRNSYSINFLNKKLQECEQNLEGLFAQWKQSDSDSIEEEKSHKQIVSQVYISQESITIRQQYSHNALTNKMFGQKKYKYKLTLEQQFPDVIYKERNIKANLALKNVNGKIIKNSNIINLCFALADDNGNWINMNRVGDPMLKGKTQVELYHGQAEFNKIYTKDISRTFPNGKVNIVIYAKPSILIYDGLTSEYEEHIDENCIQPLIISDVVIKAKKKY